MQCVEFNEIIFDVTNLGVLEKAFNISPLKTCADMCV